MSKQIIAASPNPRLMAKAVKLKNGIHEERQILKVSWKIAMSVTFVGLLVMCVSLAYPHLGIPGQIIIGFGVALGLIYSLYGWAYGHLFAHRLKEFCAEHHIACGYATSSDMIAALDADAPMHAEQLEIIEHISNVSGISKEELMDGELAFSKPAT